MKVQKRWISLLLTVLLVVSSMGLANASGTANFTVVNGVAIAYLGTDTVITAAMLEAEGVKVIGADAFQGNESITSVFLPDSITAIHPRSFKDCKALESIHLSSELTKIPSRAFEDCAALQSITIPGKVTAIEESAFQNCISLKAAEGPIVVKDKYKPGEYRPIAAAVVTLGNNAFYNCPKLVISCFKGSVLETYAINNGIKYESLDPIVESITPSQEMYVVVHDKTVPGTVTIPVTIKPDIAANVTLGWSSSDVSVAEVSTSGTVTTKAPGIVAIVVASDDVLGVHISVPVIVLDDTKTWQKWGDWWFYCKSSTEYAIGWETIAGKTYHFDKFGRMEIGWQKIDGLNYYFDPATGVMATNWLKLGDDWYYMGPDGAMKTGWQQIGGLWFYLDEKTGIMKTGWQKIGNATFYFEKSGVMAGPGWHWIGGKWYLMDENGAVVSGWRQVGGVWYYMNPADGQAMVTGWQKIGNLWYFFNGSGAMQTGWQRLGGSWYYFDASGKMLTGWQRIGGSWYYFEDNGVMHTGWLELGGKWYYMLGGGQMVTGTRTIDGTRYRFDANGVLQ